MKIIMVSDEFTIINTQGIRFIEKITGNKYGWDESEFKLRVTYRKEVLHYAYKTEQLRDAQYDRLRKVLDKEYGDK